VARTTILFGVILLLQGFITYFFAIELGASTRSGTALIPAYVGAALAVCGLFALRPGARKHAMHAAAVIGLLGFLASAGRFAMRPTAPTSVGPASLLLMALICALFVMLCVRSFIEARRARARGFDVGPRT
jgi:hypothetical protein